MAEVPADEWDALTLPCDRPLLSWGFLSLLEASGSMTSETGWIPSHALARENGVLVAAASFYIKTHSWGEFVFDFELAELAERLGKAWYPKLVGMVPATPAPAWRVLVRPEARGTNEELVLSRLLIESASEAARGAGLGGLHILWPEPETASRLAASPDFIAWEHQSFLWTDSGYGDFAGYLDSFSKNMRRNVRREREAIAAAGIETRMIDAKEAASHPAILETMAELYELHNDKFGPWAARFLEPDFFLRLPEFLPDDGWLLSAAFDRGSSLENGDEPVALAFLLAGEERLYGRFWGYKREVPGLHFELCYYQPIEYALEHGIASFDPGMGSPHKARRGFASRSAPSFHLVFDRKLASIMKNALPSANAEERAQIDALNEDLPFKKNQAGERTL
jgi:hypothetical protein